MQTRPTTKVKKTNKKSKKDPNLVLRPAFAGQQCAQFRIQSTPQLFSTTVTTGVIASDISITNQLINNWATRFAATWEEYRIVKCEADVRLFSSTAPGLLVSWWDEKDLTTPPTLAESRSKSTPAMSFNASSVDRRHKFVWTPHDLLDLQYTGSASDSNPVDFKIYSDTTNYGSSAVATAYGEACFFITVQFRGFL